MQIAAKRNIEQIFIATATVELVGDEKNQNYLKRKLVYKTCTSGAPAICIMLIVKIALKVALKVARK